MMPFNLCPAVLLPAPRVSGEGSTEASVKCCIGLYSQHRAVPLVDATPTAETAANYSERGTKSSFREEVDYLPRRLAVPRCLLCCKAARETERARERGGRHCHVLGLIQKCTASRKNPAKHIFDFSDHKMTKLPRNKESPTTGIESDQF